MPTRYHQLSVNKHCLISSEKQIVVSTIKAVLFKRLAMHHMSAKPPDRIEFAVCRMQVTWEWLNLSLYQLWMMAVRLTFATNTKRIMSEDKSDLLIEKTSPCVSGDLWMESINPCRTPHISDKVIYWHWTLTHQPLLKWRATSTQDCSYFIFGFVIVFITTTWRLRLDQTCFKWDFLLSRDDGGGRNFSLCHFFSLQLLSPPPHFYFYFFCWTKHCCPLITPRLALWS